VTGVAAQLCGDRKAVESLGYHVDPDGLIYETPPSAPRSPPPVRSPAWVRAKPSWSTSPRPAATFIAYNYNTSVDVAAFEAEAKRILAEVEAECGWMYETWHV
jgi:hypothetical protein